MQPPETSGFYTQTRAAKKIIVVDLGFLGDSLHLVPALWEIKDHYPQAELHVLSTPLGCEVVRMVPAVHRAWSLELAPARRSWREHAAMIRNLRREQFDVAYNFNGTDRSIILTALTGARWRVAHLGGRSHFWNAWLIPHWVARQEDTLPVFEQRRQVLAACGFSLQPARFDLRLKQADVDWASSVVPGGAVHLSLNSANPLKEWPVQHYAALVKLLWREYPALQLVASASPNPRELGRIQAFVGAVNDARLQILPANLSIGQLAAAVQRCRLHFGPDSGVVHLSVALGVPSVSLFRDQRGYAAWLPPNEAHRYFLAACGCVDHKNCPCESSGLAACLEKISPEEVVAMMQGFLR